MGCGGSKPPQEGRASGGRRPHPHHTNSNKDDAPPQRKGSGVVGESGALSPGRQPQVDQTAALKVSVDSLDEARLVAAGASDAPATEPEPEPEPNNLAPAPGPLKKRPGLTDSAENFFERLDTMVEGTAEPA